MKSFVLFFYVWKYLEDSTPTINISSKINFHSYLDFSYNRNYLFNILSYKIVVRVSVIQLFLISARFASRQISRIH